MKLNGSRQEYSCCLLNVILPGEELFSWWSLILPSSQLPLWCSSQPGGGWKMGKGSGVGRRSGTHNHQGSISFKVLLVLSFQCTQLFAFHLSKWRNSEEWYWGLFQGNESGREGRATYWLRGVSPGFFFLLITSASQFCFTKLKSCTGLPAEKPERRLLGSEIWKEPSACNFAITILDIS